MSSISQSQMIDNIIPNEERSFLDKTSVGDYINNFFKTLNKPISDADVQLLVDHSFGSQMSGFHGIPLFIKLLCETKLEDEKLDLANISPPFLYQKTLRKAFDLAKIRMESDLDTNPAFFKSDMDGLYDQVLEGASRHAFQEFLAHRGTTLDFAVPDDENLPLWILEMREMGFLSNDSSETIFEFNDKTLIEYLAAEYVALNPLEALPLVPFSDEFESIWLFLCHFACWKQNSDGFFKKLLKQGITTSLLAEHVAERSFKKYALVPKEIRDTENRQEILALSEKHQIKLLVQIANSLPKNLLMDALLDKHGFVVLFTPSQFKWMAEWCGHYGAIDVLKWFDEKTRFRSSALSEQNCRYALCRALQRQLVCDAKSTIEFLTPRATELSVDDAVTTESTVALQMALKRKNKFEDDVMLVALDQVVKRIDSNPNLIVALCLFAEFTADQLSKLNLLENPSSPACFFAAVSLRVALPEVADIWNFTKNSFDKIVVADEMKKRPIGQMLLVAADSHDISSDWCEAIAKHFVEVCIPTFGKKLAKMMNFVKVLDLSKMNEFVADATVEVICDSFSLLRSLNLSNCNITDASLQSLLKLEMLENIDFSKCAGITKTEALHSLLLMRRRTIKTLRFEDIPNISKAYCTVAPTLIADPSLSSIDLYDLPPVTDEVVRMLLEFGNPVTSLILTHCKPVSDAGIEHVSRLSGLTYLDLTGCSKITDTSLELICGLSALTTLNLACCDLITDRGLQCISILPNVKYVGCSKCRHVTDGGVKHLARLPKITALDLSWDDLTDAGVAHLSTCVTLETIDISFCDKITDAALQHLSKIPGITSINVFWCKKITDVGLEYISTLHNITALDISFCANATNVGLEHIVSKLSKLKSINISGCGKMENAVEKIKLALPQCFVVKIQ